MTGFFVLFCLVCSSLFADNDRVIVVYGASCSGKSTLSKAIVNEFGALWCVIDRDVVLDQHQNSEKADEYLLKEINNALKMGFSVVVDTQDPADIVQALMPQKPFMVFVYAKLPQLNIRDQHRCARRRRTKECAYQARSWMYNTFANLLTTETGKTPFVDTIEPHELTDDVFVHNLNQHSQTLFYALAQANTSHANTSRAVYATCPCDVIIKSDQYTIEESIQQIKDHYASWKNSRII